MAKKPPSQLVVRNSQPRLRLLALALAPMLLGGCIYLTPPTGLRFGDHSAEFAGVQQSGATQVEFETYDAPDFQMIYPNAWTLSEKRDVAAGTNTTLRVAAGQRSSTGEAEGINVLTYYDRFDQDPQKASAKLAEVAKLILAAGLTDFSVVSETPANVAGEPGLLIETRGKDPDSNHEFHYLAQAVVREGRGYIIVISTLESRFETYKPLFDHVFKNFKFLQGAPPADAQASGEPTFPDLSASGAAAVEYAEYEAADFAMTYPKAWTMTGRHDVPAGTTATMRASAGQRSGAGQAEGVTVTTMNQALDPDPAKAMSELAKVVKASLAGNHPDFKVVEEKPASLAGAAATQIEGMGTDPLSKVVFHYVARSAMHRGRGYIVVFSTIESRYEGYEPIFEHMFGTFELKAAAPPYADATASGEAK